MLRKPLDVRGRRVAQGGARAARVHEDGRPDPLHRAGARAARRERPLVLQRPWRRRSRASSSRCSSRCRSTRSPRPRARTRPACTESPVSGTRTRVLHWFVSGGVAKTSDGGRVRHRRRPARRRARRGGAASCWPTGGERLPLRAARGERGDPRQGPREHERDVPRRGARARGHRRHARASWPWGARGCSLEPQAKRRVEVGFSDRFGPLVGSSPKMRRVFGVLEKVASTPLAVLIARRDRDGQGARRQGHPRRERPQERRPSWSSTAAASRRRSPRASSSGTRRAPSPARASGARARWPRPTGGPSSSTSWASCRSSCSPSSCAR